MPESEESRDPCGGRDPDELLRWVPACAGTPGDFSTLLESGLIVAVRWQTHRKAIAMITVIGIIPVTVRKDSHVSHPPRPVNAVLTRATPDIKLNAP